MEAIEIVLLIAGVLIFVLSFVIPAKKEEMSAEAKESARKEIAELISADVETAKGKIGDIVDETVNYSIEKTERSLERMTNEKIMAVNEYADTVLGEINKNHTEVMFLYDMLNEKHQSIKETAAEVTQAVKRAEMMTGEAVVLEPTQVENFKAEPVAKKTKTEKSSAKKARSEKQIENMPVLTNSPDLNFIPDGNDDGKNNNDMILALHKQGKSNVAIAKELGLGVGEVKLVIGLFEGM